MVFRFLIRYLINNQQLIDKLADSYPIRRAAQWVVYFTNKSKQLTEDTIKENLSKQNVDKLGEKLEAYLKNIRDQLEKKLKQ
jgi:hypothetical protein